jgi:peptidylglycine monooxygenase
VTSGYRVRFDKETGEQEWIEIGRRSPQLPQMFYPATNKVPIRKGDVIAARCTMKNFVDHDVSIGATGEDEMCNFYMMYYVEGDQLLDDNHCTSSGPPYWSFKNFKVRAASSFNWY